jgi:hypothetical protein
VFELTIRALGGLLSTYQFLDGLPIGVEAQYEYLARFSGMSEMDGIKSGGPGEDQEAGALASVWNLLGLSNGEKKKQNHKRTLKHEQRKHMQEADSELEIETESIPIRAHDDTRVDLKSYQDRILALALDLGTRLLPAFNTPTGIPYARVNLRHGLMSGESEETCEWKQLSHGPCRIGLRDRYSRSRQSDPRVHAFVAPYWGCSLRGELFSVLGFTTRNPSLVIGHPLTPNRKVRCTDLA